MKKFKSIAIWLIQSLLKRPLLLVLIPTIFVPNMIEWHATHPFWDNFFQAQMVAHIIENTTDNLDVAPIETIESEAIYELAERFDVSENEAYQIYLKTQINSRNIIHTVQKGEGLYDIAAKYDIRPADIIVANDLVHLDHLVPGSTLIIPVSGPPGRNTSVFSIISNVSGNLLRDSYTVRPGDTVAKIAAHYGLSASTIIEANNLKNGEIRVGQRLTLPEDHQFILPDVGRLYWPVDRSADHYISNFYQPGHLGIDIVLEVGVPVRAVADGYVEMADWSPLGYGNVVVLNHGSNFYSLYGHLDAIQVEEGDFVNREAVIGLAGNTGNSSSPHLHLEIKEGYRFLDPCLYLPGYCLWETGK